ncbi:PREDICTED: uncharacterized protein LOC104610510 isoform X2 [Nelumbo nucifera]|uniref:Uncharacterized protein LOC104610510 isoform X2 n=1 Tax=Nelumbo nucifera TaxID=4432 RepID=A0A1U8BG10_NELNU|nr:PREDICTED: uncharacterized protein LOC104610510 isoform X2 [Nelumbo nucifera]
MENSKSTNLPRRLAIQIENPFALKVGQVFTGFGIGCGVGIGVGRPLNLGAIPALQQVMSATRGATDAFSGIGRHVNSSLRRLGAKNIEAGIGCGVGFGHGFGVGLAIKPRVIHHIQSCLGEVLAKMMMKFGNIPGLPSQNVLPGSLQSSMSMINDTSMQNQIGNIMQSASKTMENTSQFPSKAVGMSTGSKYASSLDTSLGSRTEKVISNFLQNSVLKDGEEIGSNNLVLKHQQFIEELMEENEKLRQILVDELKVPESKLKARNTSRTKSLSPCSDCFECRRRQQRSK